MEERISHLITNWKKRNIEGRYYETKEQAIAAVLEFLPQQAAVGFSGSQTLEQLGLVKRLEARGNTVYNPYKSGLSQEEAQKIRREASQADYYLASPNAISQKGELVFFSAWGNRTAGIAYARHMVAVAGINKVVPTLEEALNRAREYATPLNCKRLSWDTPCFKDGICRQEICFFPEYKRMCCQSLIVEAEAAAGRLSVVLVGDTLGF